MVLLLTVFGCWMTLSCGFQTTEGNHTGSQSTRIQKRAAFMGTGHIYPCYTQVAGQMFNCHIAAIILTATHKGKNKTWGMSPNHRPSQNLVSKFKRAKLNEIGINQVI